MYRESESEMSERKIKSSIKRKLNECNTSRGCPLTQPGGD
jgi:hypothetical protein